ncbi:MAG TPA: ATP synthase subunit I [Desulfobulbus sp.]|nr:ATP synthase subunit I [Desulfobulbus sp.]
MMNMGQEKPEGGILRTIQRVSLLLTAIFAGAGFFLWGTLFAQSVLIGSLLVNGSFWMLKRDAEQILGRVATSNPDVVRTVQRLERVRFVFKFYAKLVILGLLLYAVSTRMQLNMIGVALGLSTVMLSVIGVVVSGGRKLYSIQSA